MLARIASAISLVVASLLFFGCSVESRGLAPPDGGPDAGRMDAAVRDGTVLEDGCVVAAETCNEVDDDCDGRVDEGFDPPSDVANCGACGMPCPEWPNGAATCTAGVCGGTCSAGFADCDGEPANGCEADLSVDGNCGGCGTLCALPNAAAACSAGECAIATCDAGYDDCDGDPSNGCETTLGTDAHCSMCGDGCSGSETCFSGACTSCGAGCDCGVACSGMCTCTCDGTCSYTCSSDCTIHCDRAASTCIADAVDANANFTGDCEAGATCRFDARGASNVYGTCDGAGTDCHYDCRHGPSEDTSNCLGVRCERGASCAIRCGTVPDAQCAFEFCHRDEARCSGWITCGMGGTCPPA